MGTGSSHSVHSVTQEEYTACTGTGTEMAAASETGSFSWTATATAGNQVFVVCMVDGHCTAGQKLTVTVDSGNGATCANPNPVADPVPDPVPVPAPTTDDSSATSDGLGAAIVLVGSVCVATLV